MLEADMRRVAQANIARFAQLLDAELDWEKRMMISRLLEEEKVRLERLTPTAGARGSPSDSGEKS
jgi:hypothetical protein